MTEPDRSTAGITIRPGRETDAVAIEALYRTVAEISGGIARLPHEVNSGYIGGFVAQSLEHGILLVAESPGRPGLVGELHTYTCGLWRFNHVLSSLTVAVHPEMQGRGIGRRLFEALLTEVTDHRPDIVRIELMTGESNGHAQALYRSMGFEQQGRFERAIRKPAGELEADIPMAWLRPGSAV